jgi:hypothetical protein
LPSPPATCRQVLQGLGLLQQLAVDDLRGGDDEVHDLVERSVGDDLLDVLVDALPDVAVLDVLPHRVVR